MTDRAYPLLYSDNVAATAEFYETFGFTRKVQNPPAGEPTYIGLLRGASELAVVSSDWPAERHGTAGDGARFEMFVFVEDLGQAVAGLVAAGATLLREPVDLPWGERVAYVADPAGNPVGLCAKTPDGGAA